MPEAKTKTEAKKDAPTEAQLATLSALTEELGVEAPEITTAVEAQSAIEALQGLSAETEPTPEPPVEPDPEEEESEEQHAAEEAQARKGADLSEKAAKRLLDKGLQAFHDTLCAYFGVETVVLAQTPGLVGFVIPGFTEQKTHADFARCQTCNGYGNVLTGSMKEGDKERPCPDPRCKGRGYWERPQAQPVAPAPTLSAVTGPTAYETPVANGDGQWAEAPAWMGDPRLNTGPTP